MEGKGEQRMMKKYKAKKATIKGFLCKRKDGGTDFYESEEFLTFYEEA